MQKISTNKAIMIHMSVMLIPFIFLCTCALFYIKYEKENDFRDTMRRFTDNSAKSCVERPVDEMKLLLLSLSDNMKGNAIEKYLSSEYIDLNMVIPSIVDSTMFFSSALVSDVFENYKIYPEIRLSPFVPSARPWYPHAGIKDEIIFSDPYETLKLDRAKDQSKLSVSVSMNIFDSHSEQVGNVAFDLDMKNMSRMLQDVSIPYDGRFEVASRSGVVVMYSNTDIVFKRSVPKSWLDKTTERYGSFVDEETGKVVYYRAYNNPGWIAYTSVNISTYTNTFESEYKLLALVILISSIFYFVVIALFRIYFKRLISLLYMSSNGLEVNSQVDNFESLYEGMVQKHKHLKEVETLSVTDTLTQAGTRRKFEQDAADLHNKNISFHLAIIDLDNFKQINDTFGHPVGDTVLKNVCRIGARILGDDYSIYRFGGEEMVVIFPGITFKQSYELMDEWQNEVAQRIWREESLKVTFSCGMVEADSAYGLDNMLEQADKLLYEAKNNGKNRIVGFI
ncbi:UNVERIFIED_ORG: diguanylate cyclase (GGDEF)-like protein [Buttiauxella agrestis ATCC 33320]